MKRFALSAVLVLLPLALFAQAKQAPQTRSLQQLGLTDSQVSQVLDIETKTREAIRQETAEVRLLQAQIDKAMLAGTVDMQAVNGLVDQLSQARASMQKTFLAARVQLQQIMGPDKFQIYMRHIRQQFARAFTGRRSVSRGLPRLGGGWL